MLRLSRRIFNSGKKILSSSLTNTSISFGSRSFSYDNSSILFESLNISSSPTSISLSSPNSYPFASLCPSYTSSTLPSTLPYPYNISIKSIESNKIDQEKFIDYIWKQIYIGNLKRIRDLLTNIPKDSTSILNNNRIKLAQLLIEENINSFEFLNYFNQNFDKNQINFELFNILIHKNCLVDNIKFSENLFLIWLHKIYFLIKEKHSSPSSSSTTTTTSTTAAANFNRKSYNEIEFSLLKDIDKIFQYYYSLNKSNDVKRNNNIKHIPKSVENLILQHSLSLMQPTPKKNSSTSSPSSPSNSNSNIIPDKFSVEETYSDEFDEVSQSSFYSSFSKPSKSSSSSSSSTSSSSSPSSSNTPYYNRPNFNNASYFSSPISPSLLLLESFSLNNISDHPIPLYIFTTLISSYCHNGAVNSSLVLLNLIENSSFYSFFYPKSLSNNNYSRRNYSQNVHPKSYYASYDNFTLLNIIYHNILRQISYSKNSYYYTLNFIKKMENKNINFQVYGIPSLLRSFVLSTHPSKYSIEAMNQQREIIREILPLFLQSSQKMLKNSLNSSKGEEEQGDEELLISPSQSATHLLKELVSLMSRFEMIDETLELISYIKKDPVLKSIDIPRVSTPFFKYLSTPPSNYISNFYLDYSECPKKDLARLNRLKLKIDVKKSSLSKLITILGTDFAYKAPINYHSTCTFLYQNNDYESLVDLMLKKKMK